MLNVPLTDMGWGQRATIVRLEGGFGLQRKLRSLGVREGKVVTLLTGQPLRGPLVISIGGRQTAIGRGMASRIIVEVSEP
jgi:ferrous iron transport protein A